jgi:hypothetical protein
VTRMHKREARADGVTLVWPPLARRFLLEGFSVRH